MEVEEMVTQKFNISKDGASGRYYVDEETVQIYPVGGATCTCGGSNCIHARAARQFHAQQTARAWFPQLTAIAGDVALEDKYYELRDLTHSADSQIANRAARLLVSLSTAISIYDRHRTFAQVFGN